MRFRSFLFGFQFCVALLPSVLGIPFFSYEPEFQFSFGSVCCSNCCVCFFPSGVREGRPLCCVASCVVVVAPRQSCPATLFAMPFTLFMPPLCLPLHPSIRSVQFVKRGQRPPSPAREAQHTIFEVFLERLPSFNCRRSRWCSWRCWQGANLRFLLPEQRTWGVGGSGNCGWGCRRGRWLQGIGS